jgi:monothiol glutaredoxin
LFACRILCTGLLEEPRESDIQDHLRSRPVSPIERKLMNTTLDTQQRIDQIVKSSDVVLFMKGTAQFPMCGFSGRAIQVLKACGVTKPATINVLEDEDIRHGIKEYSNWPTVPQLYVKGEFVGGSDIMTEMYQSGELQQLLDAGTQNS